MYGWRQLPTLGGNSDPHRGHRVITQITQLLFISVHHKDESTEN